MARYKKTLAPVSVIGMLHLVDVRLMDKTTNESIKHKILLVGCEAHDIERKVKWMFDVARYNVSLKGVEKVREKMHILSTVITQEKPIDQPIIQREEGSSVVPQQAKDYDPDMYAIGIVTKMIAKDEEHALRKLGHALVSHATEVTSSSGAKLSEDSTITIEKIAKSSGYALPRDVSQEANKAHVLSVGKTG